MSGTSSLRVWAALLTLYLVWGSTYLGILFAIESLPPYVMGALRFAISGGLMLAWSVARNPGSWPSRREVGDSVIVGGILLGGGMGLVAVAEQTIPSSIAALLIALLPAWLVVLGRVFVGETISRPVAIGIVIGLIGVAILAGPWEATGGLEPVGLLAVLGSPILWAIGSIYSAHKAVPPSDPIRAVAIQMLSGSAVMVVLGVLVGDFARFDPTAVTDKSLLAVGYLVVVGSIIGYSAYIWLLRNAPLARIGTYAYVNPVVAFILGAVLAGESITVRTVVAAAVILFAVALIVTARGRAARLSGAEVASGVASPGDDSPSPRAAAPIRSSSPAP
ncbi:MAG TPA: EamA family transporter [Vitreimonas sp.]|nr:EamA family transporter [Vitreimonas sp.]